MIGRIDSAQLQQAQTAQKTELILSAARASLSDRLWQAALGADASNRQTVPGADRTLPGMSLDSLLALLAGESGEDPRKAGGARQPEPAPSAPAPAEAARSEPVAPQGLGVNEAMRGPLDAAAARTGIPATVLAAIVNAEAAKDADGRWRIYSRNPRSSAAGLGQFLSGSWKDMAKREGTWLNAYAQAHGWLNERGDIRGGAKSELLALRYDPEAAIQTIADYARENLGRLRAAGVDVGGDADKIAQAAYLGHHLGAGDAVRFLSGGLDSGRARHLLDAQIGREAAGRRIAAFGSASAAHRDWLLGYVDRNVRPERFAARNPGVSAARA